MELTVWQGEDRSGKLGDARTPARSSQQSCECALMSPFCSASTCSDGTCDGCNFHFLWESVAACPLCSAADYHAIVSSCVAGIQVGVSAWGLPRRQGNVISEFLVFLPDRRLLMCGENQSCARMASPCLSRESPSAKR